MTSESFVEKWNAGKKIFAVILIINVSAILASAILPMASDNFVVSELIPCPEDIIEVMEPTKDSTTPDTCLNMYSNSSVFVALGIIVVVNMVGFLAFFNRMSHSPDLTKGEMRKTFAVTIITLYLLVVALTVTEHISWNDNPKLFENFTYVVITVIIFYFGSRAWKQAKGNNDDSSVQNGDGIDNSKEVKIAEAEVAETTLAVKKAENKTKAAELQRGEVKTKKEIAAVDAEIKEAKENESRVKKNLKEATEKAESKKNESRKPEERIVAAKIELKIEEMNGRLLSERKTNTTSAIDKDSTLSATSSSPKDIQTLMDAVVSEFEQFVAQNPKISGDVVNAFQQKFTANVGGLISQRNSAINEAIEDLDRTSPDFSVKRQELLEQRRHVTKNLAISTEDRERLNSRLNAIHKQSVTNFNSKKIINGIDLTDKSPREISRLISNGDIPPMIIGPKSFEMLEQELTSMLQSRKISDMTSDEQEAFSNLLDQRIQETLTLPDAGKRDKLLDIVEKVKQRNK